jgi:cbb3-type cytochrome oxidase subunit 3
MMKALGYTWRVLVNLFYVALILYVFDKTKRAS